MYLFEFTKANCVLASVFKLLCGISNLLIGFAYAFVRNFFFSVEVEIIIYLYNNNFETEDLQFEFVIDEERYCCNVVPQFPFIS